MAWYQPFTKGGLYGTSSLFPNGFGNGEAGQRFWDQNPAGAFTRYLAERGFDMNSRRGQWASNQLGDLKNAYTAALGDNPELSFYGPKKSFLNTVDLNSAWLDKSFQERGETPSLFATRARMLPRGQ